jgi:hypothetical protein
MLLRRAPDMAFTPQGEATELLYSWVLWGNRVTNWQL